MKKLLRIALLLAFVVVILGAWARLADAGLGCPDWPTCYGSITVPDTVDESYTRPLEKDKAWKEMIHRYAASLLGLLAIVIAVFSFRKVKNQRLLSSILLTTVIFQGLLGALTVTKLVHPGIVSLHLAGGFITTSLIYIMLVRQNNAQQALYRTDGKIYIILFILVLVLQIFLGGWTSTNYAAISCGDFFPSCLGSYYHPIDFNSIFYWGEFGVDYEFGVLPESARIGIQLLHRIGAILVVIFALLMFVKLSKYSYLRNQLKIIGIILLVQIGLGISNVIFSLPLPVAVLHNATALVLLLQSLKMFYVLR